MQLYLKNWYRSFFDELKRTQQLRIVSPFVKEQLVRNMQTAIDFEKFEFITRYSLFDFAQNVSSLGALKFCVERGASVFGIKELHSKVYLFDKRAAIVSSANLTNGGLINNFECGIYTDDKRVINQLHSYFDELKALSPNRLTGEMCDAWETLISDLEIVNIPAPSLPDFGASQIQSDETKRYYVKFLGTSKTRHPLTVRTTDVIRSSLCHYAVGFSPTKKPRRINDDDVIYIARMTQSPNDFAIFGRGTAIKFNEARDVATEEEIKQRVWKKDWPYYLRINNPVFLDGTLGECILLYDLIREFDYAGFASTMERYENGDREINPYRSLAQQPYVQLTPRAVEWLEERFQHVAMRIGTVPNDFLASLPQSYE